MSKSLKFFSVNDLGINEFFQIEGYTLFKDLLSNEEIDFIRQEFFQIIDILIDKYHIPVNGGSSEKRAFEVFSHNQQFRKNLYNLLQELRSINFLCSSKQFTTIFQKINLKYPVLRNQAIRIDFLQEPQFLQGIHQDVRGMRSSNCLNFWIPLQDVNDKIGTLAVYSKSHRNGGIKPKETNEFGYQVFTDQEVAEYDRILLDMPKGSVLMFHPYLFHASFPSKESLLRLTITLRFDDIADMEWLYNETPDFYNLDIQNRKIYK
ncbi:phytanoyl-CoA dioxygenase PhyH [Leptospira noguchii str. 1993005606]|uniref:Phytanoyl-CoA dioxygenase PhyH n=2 Tax=Leptospira noguchii TaxID=28182 RepID=M6Y9X1_9LEPT|nr:phytanoyl-CoA dioxygenase family protein [Leptospira noguchii]EMN01223.1 phytanoyl-CoA dioxygenase PhyH [Leptospira noguchii str. 2007001578]EMO90525.1 phytanoyl-CoA dioxygenase PhyH [Leptospira noguchii str. 2001034031]EPE83591.1 phytanoyl-CoA dioxygenase PhyH [Leptospira noguchii str. 1993005606]